MRRESVSVPAPRLFRKRSLSAWALALGAGALAAWAWPPTANDHFFKQPLVAAERTGLSLLFALRGPRPSAIDPRITIVGFTRESERNLGVRWPVPRRLQAEVVRRLHDDGAKLVVFDTLFADATNPEDDRLFDRALRDAAPVAIAARIDRDPVRRQKSLEAPYYDDELGIDFEAAARVGVAEVPLDDDGVVRSFVPGLRSQGEWVPSLAVAAYLALHGKPADDFSISTDGVKVGGREFGPVVSSAQDPVDLEPSPIVSLMVDYPAGSDAFFASYSYDQVCTGRFPKGTFRDKIVFVGVSGFELARELDDMYSISSTALAMDAGTIGAQGSRSADFARIPGIFIQAHYLNALLTGSFVKPVPPLLHGGAVFALTSLGVFVLRRYFNWRGPLFLALLVLGYATLALLLFDGYGIHLPFVTPLAVLALVVSTVAWVERSAIRKRWSGYVAPEVLETILQSEEGEEAKRYDAIVVFADVRGFTAFSGEHPPERVVRLLNQHYERMARLIHAERGTIDKFMGDGILAVFGAPVPLDDAPWRAVRAAWRMVDASREPLFDEGAEFQFSMGVGISSGPLVAGQVGSRQRHDFTVIGDVVNTAARIQGVTGAADVVLDQAVYEAVAGRVQAESLGEIELKGKARPVACFRVTGFL